MCTSDGNIWLCKQAHVLAWWAGKRRRIYWGNAFHFTLGLICISKLNVIPYSKLSSFPFLLDIFPNLGEYGWYYPTHLHYDKALLFIVFTRRSVALIIRGLMSGHQLVVKLCHIFHGALLPGWPHFDGERLRQWW